MTINDEIYEELGGELYEELGGDEGIHALRTCLFCMGYRYARAHDLSPHDALDLADEGTELGWDECRELVLEIEDVRKCQP